MEGAKKEKERKYVVTSTLKISHDNPTGRNPHLTETFESVFSASFCVVALWPLPVTPL